MNFSYLPKKQNFKIHMKLYTLPDEVELKEGYTMRRTFKKDAKQLRDLINGYLSKFHIRAKYTKREVEHWFTFKEGACCIIN